MIATLETVLRVISLNTQVTELYAHPELQEDPIVKYNLSLASAAFTLTVEQIKADLAENCCEFVDLENINVFYTIKDGEKVLYEESSCISEKCKQVIEQCLFEANFNEGGSEPDAVSDIDNVLEHSDSVQSSTDNNVFKEASEGDLHNRSSAEDFVFQNLTEIKSVFREIQLDEGSLDQESTVDDDTNDTLNDSTTKDPADTLLDEEEYVFNDTLQYDEPNNSLQKDTSEATNQDDITNETQDEMSPPNAILDDDANRSTFDRIFEVPQDNSYSPMVNIMVEAIEIKDEVPEVMNDNMMDEGAKGISTNEDVLTNADSNKENMDQGESLPAKRSFDDSTSTYEPQRKRNKIGNEKEFDNGTKRQRGTLPDGWTKENSRRDNTNHYKYISPEGDVYNCGLKKALDLYLENFLPEGWEKLKEMSTSDVTVYKAPDGSLFQGLTKVLDFIQKNKKSSDKTLMNMNTDLSKEKKESLMPNPMSFVDKLNMLKGLKKKEKLYWNHDTKLPKGWIKEKWKQDHYKYISPTGVIYECGLKKALKRHNGNKSVKKAKNKSKHVIF